MTDETKPAPVTLPSHIGMVDAGSSHHSRYGYDSANSHLYIDFAKPGADKPNIYRYSNVTPEDYAAYQGSESRGKHFIANIKPNAEKFPYTKVSNGD